MRAPPTSARSTGKRSLPRRTYLPSSSRLPAPPFSTAGIVSVEVVLGVRADAGDGQPLGIDPARDLRNLRVGDPVEAGGRPLGGGRAPRKEGAVGGGKGGPRWGFVGGGRARP